MYGVETTRPSRNLYSLKARAAARQSAPMILSWWHCSSLQVRNETTPRH